MTEATSAAAPIRLRLCIPMTTARPASGLVKFDISVSITRGATAAIAREGLRLDRAHRYPPMNYGAIRDGFCRRTRSPRDSVSRLLLASVCRAPERARVDAIGIDFQHCVVELARGRCCRIQAVEIAKVLPRLGNDAGIIVVFWHLVPGDYVRAAGIGGDDKRLLFRSAIGRTGTLTTTVTQRMAAPASATSHRTKSASLQPCQHIDPAEAVSMLLTIEGDPRPSLANRSRP